MAMASFSAVVKDDLSCPVCYNLLKDPHTPKELDCSHVCCLECIQQMIEGGRRMVDCPECRHVTRIPEEGVAAMKTVYRLRSLAEKHHQHLEEKIKRNDAACLCPEHNIAIEFVCTKCNVTGCSTCVMYGHHGPDHDVIDTATAFGEQLAQMTKVFGQINTEIEEYAQGIQELNKLETEMVERSTEQKTNIKNQLELVIANASENARALEEKYDRIEQPKIIRVCREKERLEKQLAHMKTVKSAVENALATTKKHEYVEQHTAVSRSILYELGREPKVAIAGLDPVIGRARFGIEKSNITLGTLLQVKPAHLTQVEEFGSWKVAMKYYSVAERGDGLLVIGTNSELHLYRRNKDGKYKKEASIALSKKTTASRPCSVAISFDGNYLVVREMVCIEVYSPSGNYEGILDLKPAPEGDGEDICKQIKPCWLQVGNDGSLLVADYNYNIVHFSSDGIYRHSVATTFPPLKMAVMPNGKIAATNWEKNRLSVRDIQSGIETVTVEIPQANAICYHKDTDSLLVGRCLKRKTNGEPDDTTGAVEQYCPTSGVLVRRLLERTDGHRSMPQDMCISANGMLLFADNTIIRAFTIA